MKNYLVQISIVLFLFSTALLSQIPNPGFENWTDGEPDGWISSNIPSFITNVTQSAESHSGSSAVKLIVGSFATIPYGGVIYSGSDADITGFPVSQRYGSLRGFYKLSSSPNKVLLIQITFSKGENPVGGGAEVFGGNVPNYAEFVIPIIYFTEDIPDTAIVNISYQDTAETWTVGGGAFVDDLSLGGFVDVKEITSKQIPTSYQLMQNYPNPFNPSTKIEYSLPEESFVQLKVYSLIGEEVATLVNQYQKAGTYRADFNAEGMQSGIYIAKLTANSISKSIKMTLLK